jgi:hypothetical protein
VWLLLVWVISLGAAVRTIPTGNVLKGQWMEQAWQQGKQSFTGEQVVLISQCLRYQGQWVV